MTSKTFKSAEYDNRELEVDVLFGNPRLLVKDFDGDSKGFIFGKADAPALALAILEAAGVEARHHSAYENGTPEAMEHIAQALTDEIGIAEAAITEAKEQAELEAEALEFMNAVRDATGANPLTGFPADASGIKSHYLIIARKAREMAKEAPSA